MARKKSTQPETSWQSKIEYLRFSYNEELEIKQWLLVRKPAITDVIQELLESDWSLKLTRHKNGRDIVATLTCRDAGREIEGRSYILQYPSFGACVLVCLWVCQVYLDDERSDGRDSNKASTVFDDLL